MGAGIKSLGMILGGPHVSCELCLTSIRYEAKDIMRPVHGKWGPKTHSK